LATICGFRRDNVAARIAQELAPGIDRVQIVRQRDPPIGPARSGRRHDQRKTVLVPNVRVPARIDLVLIDPKATVRSPIGRRLARCANQRPAILRERSHSLVRSHNRSTGQSRNAAAATGRSRARPPRATHRTMDRPIIPAATREETVAVTMEAASLPTRGRTTRPTTRARGKTRISSSRWSI
jgi:hypothetical protein